ncbi:hypothetical protein HPB50_027917 [Hyalomma asiaticum]|nr:hypothetical protein HPB50_027917 [Hyalomma asiaticum]
MSKCCVPNCRNCTEKGKAFFAVPRAKSAVRRRLQCVLRMGRDRPVPKRPRVCEVLHKEQCKKPARARERAMHEVLEQNTKYTLLPDRNDEAPENHSYYQDEDEQLRSLKERNEFAAWLHDRDREKHATSWSALTRRLTDLACKELEYKRKVLHLAKEHIKARELEKVQQYCMRQEQKRVVTHKRWPQCLATPKTVPTTDKAATIEASTDHEADSALNAERTEDPQLGEGMDAESTPRTTVVDMPEDDIYNGACWKVVRNKRRARNAAALEASIPKTASEHPLTEPRPRRAKRLPPLPFRDEKVILRPLGGLRLGDWPRPTLATMIWAAAGVSPSDCRDLILRTRPEENLAVMSTPSSHVADTLLNLQELSLGQRTFPVSAYLAAADDSCKGIVAGLEPGTPSHMLAEEMQAPAIQILQTRMMGHTNIALVTFEGLRIPRLVWFLGAELHCYPHRPRQQVCKTCLKLGHRADHCPTPDVTVCEQCGICNPIFSHPCSPRCKSCGGDHVTTDPMCPRCRRHPFNKTWVKKAIAEGQRKMTACANASSPFPVEPVASGTLLKKGGRSRSKMRSRFPLQGTHKIEVPFPISHPVDLWQHPREVPDCSGITDIPTAVHH